MPAPTVYVCDPQPILLEGIRSLLGRTREFVLVGESTSASAAESEIAALNPRLLLIGNSPGWRELSQLIDRLRNASPATRTVLWGEHISDSDRHRAIESGLSGVFRRTSPVATLLACLREVAAGRVWVEPADQPAWEGPHRRPAGARLTPREKDIVRLVGQGLRNRAIAEQLSIKSGTVKVHLMHVFEKTGVQDRYQLAMRAPALLGDAAGPH